MWRGDVSTQDFRCGQAAPTKVKKPKKQSSARQACLKRASRVKNKAKRRTAVRRCNARYSSAEKRAAARRS